MGARGYIPQLGRFEQADPQPGGGADAYSYTSGDPVNSADPSVEWTSTITYNLGAAQAGPAEAGLPEDYLAAGAIMPPPVDLQVEAEFNAHPPWGAAATFTGGPNVEWLGVRGRGAMTSNVISDGWNWVKRNAKRILTVAIGGVATAVIGGVTLVASIGCFGSQVDADELECYKVATFGAGFTVAAAGVTVKAWYSIRENRP